ncbi:MAG: ribonuclease domain-containing protein [Actinomycetia bacterium]|nr:ribonuclease domain-containing protein [Actinomycetes bacterium]
MTRRSTTTPALVAVLMVALVLGWWYFQKLTTTTSEAPATFPVTTSASAARLVSASAGPSAGPASRSSAAGPAPGSSASGEVDPETRLPWVPASQLAPEARQVLVLIDEGGPFPYRQDGQVFGNYEQRLPQRPHGFYREYTVKTASHRGRGPVRIVTGGEKQWYFYTGDHYASFSRIRR